MGFWDLFSNWQGGAITTAIAAIPLISLLALTSQEKLLNVTGWGFNAYHGLHSRIRLFIEGLNSSAQTSQSSYNLGAQNTDRLYLIEKISHQTSAQNNKRAALVVQLPFNSMGRFSDYKWCIPASSPLKKTTQSTTSTTESSQEPCKLKYFSESSASSETNEGVISTLLSLITKFIELQHAANILMLYDLSHTYETNSNNGTIKSKLEKIKSACRLSSSETKDILKDLFLSSDLKKRCLVSPLQAKLNLKLQSNDQVASVQQTSLTKDKFSGGTITGNLSYGVFDYYDYTKPKAIPFNNGKSRNKNTFFHLNWPLTYNLNSNSEICTLENLHKQVISREIKLKTIWDQCIFPNI